MTASLPINEEQQQWLKLDNQLCFQLYLASKSMTQLYRPLLQALDITYPQYLVMLVLWESLANGEPIINLKQLGEQLFLDSGTLTPLLKRLQQQGLIHRQRDTNDERVVNIELTEKGAQLSEKASSVPVTLFCKIETPTEDLLLLKEQLEKLNRQMQQILGS